MRAGGVVVGIVLMAGVAAGGCHARLAPVPAITTPPTVVAANHPPTVTAHAEHTTVKPGDRVTLSADVYDPDGDHLSIQWSAPAGTLNNPTGARTYWTAPEASGPVAITIRVEDGRGESASATVTVSVAP